MSSMRLAALATVVFALVLAVPALASAPRSGALHVTKECSDYHGLAGEHCTITSSNLDAIPAGSRVVYASAADFVAGVLDSDLVLHTRGANAAYGHVVFDLATGTGTVTFSGGTGQFKKFSASIAVSPLGWPNFAWGGTYSY
ncbi:MAG: hypothetical protein ACRDMK_04275 [Gaiellaceae bacterium]